VEESQVVFITSCRLTPRGEVGDCVAELAVAVAVCEVTAPSAGETGRARRAMKRTSGIRVNRLAALNAPGARRGFINAEFYRKSPRDQTAS